MRPLITMKFARITFLVAAVYGILGLAPQYFLEGYIGRTDPPAFTNPEFFYGFIGVALSFQIVFLMISRAPVRFRPLMLASVMEKFSFGIAAVVLYIQGRLSANMLGAGLVDLVLGTLFIVGFLKTPKE